MPYESGMDPIGDARKPLDIKFYLTAILFVIFDLELVYIFAWAVAIRDLGWAGYLGVLLFVVILLSGLIYEWRMGSLDWAAPQKRSPNVTAR